MNFTSWLTMIVASAAITPGVLAGQGTLLRDSVFSPGLGSNVTGDTAMRPVFVYLPPSYRTESTRRYPVLYLLHGASSSPREWFDGTYQGFDLKNALDSLIAARAIPEFIVVAPDVMNKLQASWYANSAVMGNWEDFIVSDLLRHIEKTYRTDNRATRRALVGHSMGGFGSLAIGFRHPDVFGMVYAISPCCIGFVGPLAPNARAWPSLSAISRWQDAPAQLLPLIGLAAALDGSKTSERLYGELPFSADGSGTIVAHQKVQRQWLSRMPPDLASAMVGRGDRQPILLLEAGSQEAGIQEGVRFLSNRLDSLHIRYTDSTFDGGHNDRVRERFTQHMLPIVGKWFSSRPSR